MDGIALVSGGKDSIYSMYLAMQQGIDIKKMINILPVEFSFMYHFPNVHIVKYIAESIGIEYEQYKLSDDPDDLKDILKNYEEKILVSGAIESEYQKNRLDFVAYNLNKIHYSPLWKKNPFLILEDLIRSGFKAKIVSVSAEGLNEDFLGIDIDEDFIKKVKSLNKRYGIHPCGEGGEYESIVLDGPIFKKRISIKEYNKIIKGSFGELNITKIELLDK